jgi:hypothetical protein
MASPPPNIGRIDENDVQLLRYHQHIALANTNNNSRSSRAASAASSQGRLLLDPGSLAALGAHFDRLILSIQQRWTEVCQWDSFLNIQRRWNNSILTLSVSSSTPNPRPQLKPNMTEPEMRSKWPTPKSPGFNRYYNRSTNYRPNGTKCAV